MDNQLRSFLANLSAETIAEPKPLDDSVDEEVRQALAICHGDAITALRITLIANAFLEAQVEELKSQISTGHHRKKTQAQAKTSENPMKAKKLARVIKA
jgi:hypothetical protein